MVNSYFLLKMFVLFIYSIINIHGFHKGRKQFSPKASVCRRGDFPAQFNRDVGGGVGRARCLPAPGPTPTAALLPDKPP